MADDNSNEQWATVELMGHAQSAGRISRPSDWGGLLRVDVPLGKNGEYRTEFYGMAAIYSVKLVSEEIARAFAHHDLPTSDYDAPIITRQQHEAVVDRLQRQIYSIEQTAREFERRLTAISALPAPAESGDDDGR